MPSFKARIFTVFLGLGEGLGGSKVMTFLFWVCSLLSEIVLAPRMMHGRVYGLWKASNGYGKGNSHGASPFGI